MLFRFDHFIRHKQYGIICQNATFLSASKIV